MLIVCVFVGVLVVFNPVDEDSLEDSSTIARRTWSRRFKIVGAFFSASSFSLICFYFSSAFKRAIKLYGYKML